MAVQTYNVTPQMVLDRLPVTGITATTRPLSTVDLAAYVEDCAAELTGIVTNAGHDPASLDDDTTAQIQSAIITGAVYFALNKIPGTATGKITSARTAWEQAKAGYKESPNSLSQRVGRAISNVDVSTDKTPSTFGAINYEF